MNFGKNDHVLIIEQIAEGMRRMGNAGSYLELGIRKAACFDKVAPKFAIANGVDISQSSVDRVDKHYNAKGYCCTTDEFFQHYCGRDYDLIFIDADHSHEASLKDFKSAIKVLNVGGLILLHDTYPVSEVYLSPHYCNDTWKTADAINGIIKGQPIGGVEYYIEACTLPVYCGLTVVRKFKNHLTWTDQA